MPASRSSVAHNYFRSSLRILFTAFLETKTQLWKLMSAISGCCIGSSGSLLYPPLYIFTERGRSFKILFKENYAIALDSCYLFTKNVKNGIEHDIDSAYGDIRLS